MATKALDRTGIQYYKKNVLIPIADWEAKYNCDTDASTGFITIHPGGYVSHSLSNDYYSGLKAAQFRKLTVYFEKKAPKEWNYKNFMDVQLKEIYDTGDEDEFNNIQRCIPITRLGTYNKINKKGDEFFGITRHLPMSSLNLKSLTIKVTNNSDVDYLLRGVYMRRSQDINESQIASSVRFNMQLDKASFNLEGVAVYYKNSEEILKMWDITDDSGKQIGINVNNEHIILIEDLNSLMPE